MHQLTTGLIVRQVHCSHLGLRLPVEQHRERHSSHDRHTDQSCPECCPAHIVLSHSASFRRGNRFKSSDRGVSLEPIRAPGSPHTPEIGPCIGQLRRTNCLPPKQLVSPASLQKGDSPIDTYHRSSTEPNHQPFAAPDYAEYARIVQKTHQVVHNRIMFRFHWDLNPEFQSTQLTLRKCDAKRFSQLRKDRACVQLPATVRGWIVTACAISRTSIATFCPLHRGTTLLSRRRPRTE